MALNCVLGTQQPHSTADAAHSGKQACAHTGWPVSSDLSASGGVSESLLATPFCSLPPCVSCLHVTKAREDSFTTREEFPPEALTPPAILHPLGMVGALLLTFLCPPWARTRAADMFLLGLQHRSQPQALFAIVIYARIHYSVDKQVALVAREERRSYERRQWKLLRLTDGRRGFGWSHSRSQLVRMTYSYWGNEMCTLGRAWEESRRLAWLSSGGWVMAPSAIKDSRMHFLLISCSHLLHPRSPSTSETPAVYFWCTRIIYIYKWLSSIVSLTEQNQRNPSVCHGLSHFLWIPRTKHGGGGLEHLPLPCRALFCSHHEDGMKVLWRIQSLRNVLHLLHGRETSPQNWIPKRGLENPQPEGLQWGWELVTGLQVLSLAILINLDGESNKETLDS